MEKKADGQNKTQKIRIELPGVDLVILTPNQYGSLLEKIWI